jgi:hypothetical protein
MMVLNDDALTHTNIISLVRARILVRANQNAIENVQIEIDDVIDVGLSGNRIHGNGGCWAVRRTKESMLVPSPK